MASGGKDKHVNIFDFDPETLQLKFARSLERHNQDYQGVAFFAWSPDSSKLAVCGPEDCDEVRIRKYRGSSPNANFISAIFQNFLDIF